MATALKRYLACLGLVCALMAVYRATLVPLLEPPAREPLNKQARVDEAKPSAWWEHLFPPDAWQNKEPMVFQTEQGTLLFQSLEQLSPSQWRLAPLTLIVPLSRDGKAAAVGDLTAAGRVYRSSNLAIVTAQQGADIQFREAPDLTSGSTPPVTGGLLQGPIDITGIDPQRSDGPQWMLKTANIRIDGRKIWTNNDVQILVGNSLAIGKDLSIFMKQDLLDSGPEDDGPWGLLDHMELIYVKQVNVALPPGGLWKGMKLGSPAKAATHAEVPARLQLESKGPLQFDFNQSIARLSDHIHVEHRFDGENLADEFLCHELKAEFSVPEGPVADPTAVMIGPMQLQVIDAIGVDSAGPIPSQATVEINAPNIDTRVTAKHLRVQLAKQQFTLESPTSASLSYMGNLFRAPSVEYASAPNDEHLGWLFASGPGELDTASTSEFGRVTVRWQKSLKLQPAEKSHVVTLDGRTFIEAADRGHMAGEHIDITLVPAPADPSAASGSPEASSPTDQRVDRVDAVGDVVVGHGAQTIRLAEMHSQFIYPETPTGAAQSLALTDSSGRPMHQWVGQPSDTSSTATSPTATSPTATSPATTSRTTTSPGPAATSGTHANAQPGSLASSPLPGSNGAASAPSQLTNPAAGRVLPPIGLPVANQPRPMPGTSPQAAASTTPMLIMGKVLHTAIIVATEPWIDNLHITGPVLVSSNAAPEQGAPAWRAEGGALQLASDPSGQVDLQLVGQVHKESPTAHEHYVPARISFGEGWIQGPIIRMNQRTGHVWMDQPGEFRVPNDLMRPRGSDRQSLGQNIEWLEPIKCRWKGRMLFNGTTANIEGDIVIDGYARTGPDRLLFVRGTCDALEIRMTQPVNIGQPGATAATVHSLTLRRNVDIKTAQTDERKNRISLEQIVVPEMTYELASNRIVSSGPGWLRSQHYSNGRMSAPGTATPTGGLSGVVPPTLQGVHLKFRDTMEVRLTEKQLSFLGRVEVGMGPAQSWDDLIDLDRMRTLKMDQTLLTGDLLRAYDVSDLSQSTPAASLTDGAWELQVMGNVNFEGKRDSGHFAGKAYSIKYAQAKNLLLVDGDGRLPAELRLTPAATSAFESFIGKVKHASFDTHTMRPIEFELAEGTQAIPRNASGGAAPQGTQPAGSPASSSPTVRPRNEVNNWLKQ